MLEHPLKVYYPYVGVYYVLVYHTHDKQHQIILAKSESALKQTFQELLKDCWYAEFKQVLKIEMVAPNVKWCQMAIEKERKRNIRDFCNTICWSMSRYFENGYELPEIFTECNKWNPSEDYAADEETEDHWGCKNCTYRIRIDMDCGEFYDLYHQQYNSIIESFRDNYSHSWQTPSKSKPEPQLKYSQALEVGEHEEIYIAYPSFGHHAHGIDLRKFEPEHWMACDAEVLFFYRKLEDLDKEWFLNLQEQVAEEHNKRSEAKEKFRELKRKEDERKKIEAIFGIFSKGNE